MKEKIVTTKELMENEKVWPVLKKAIDIHMDACRKFYPYSKIELVDLKTKWHITIDGVPDCEIDAIDLKQMVN